MNNENWAKIVAKYEGKVTTAMLDDLKALAETFIEDRFDKPKIHEIQILDIRQHVIIFAVYFSDEISCFKMDGRFYTTENGMWYMFSQQMELM